MNWLSFLALSCLLANTFGNPSFQDAEESFEKEPWSNKIGSRIIGGLEAEKAFPYQVSLKNYGTHFCGGSILNEKWILTAGHCLSGARPSQVTVVAGTNNITEGGLEYKSKRLIVHPNYSRENLTGDIGLIELVLPLNFSSTVKPISLPKININRPHTRLVATGWGRTSIIVEVSPTLQYLVVKTVDQRICRLFYEKVNEKNICTIDRFGKGMCKGDSGSPLVLNGTYQIGIVSWGITACALGIPDIHTRVYSYVEWINSYINN